MPARVNKTPEDVLNEILVQIWRLLRKSGKLMSEGEIDKDQFNIMNKQMSGLIQLLDKIGKLFEKNKDLDRLNSMGKKDIMDEIRKQELKRED